MVNSAFRAGSHAQGIGAVLASGGQEKPVRKLTAADNLDARLRALLPGVLHGASGFALHATIALQGVDGKGFGSDHFEHLS
jgi:hypothetical protein